MLAVMVLMLASGFAFGAQSAPRGVPAPADAMLGPPAWNGAPIQVGVGLHIINIAAIDEVAETFTIDGYLFETWKDPRLAFRPESGGADERRYHLGDIWVPKLELINAASPRDRYDAVIVAGADGTVNYTERFKAVLSSKFQLKRFPFDTQTLEIVVHPFVSSVKLVTLNLNGHKTWLSSELEAYSSLAQWNLRTVTPRIGQARYFDGSEIPEIRFEVSVERRFMFYVWKVLLPLTLMVFLSWAAMFVEESDLTNQVTIVVTTMLTVIAFAFAISATMPRVPYLTYIDSFFLQCYVFVIIAMAELMTVHVTHRSERAKDLGIRIRRISRFGVPLAFLASNLILIEHFLG